MIGFLDRIAAAKRLEVDRLRRERPVDSLGGGPDRPAGAFRESLSGGSLALIAEVKRRSPSRGLLRGDVDAAGLARCYETAGASAVSVLTDGPFFGGSARDLLSARQSASVPLLRKEFVIDEYQLHETRHLGADAVLLIVRLLTPRRLREWIDLSAALGLCALVEVHDERELATALDCGARIVGVNSRDLDTFETDLDRALGLRDRIPARCVAVAESGIRDARDVAAVRAAGFDACLVGEALMRTDDPGGALSGLLEEEPR